MPDSVKQAIAAVAKMFKPILKIVLIVTLVIIIISSCIYYIFIKDGNYEEVRK